MSFNLIILGCLGGPREDNLSSYLLSFKKSPEFIALDCGTLLSGIAKALARGAFDGYDLQIAPHFTPEGEILRNHLKGYLISHSHIDHLAALIINSQIDVPKPLLGIDQTIDNIRDHLFNWKIWPNYGSEGKNPSHLYRYLRLPLSSKVRIPGTSFRVEPFLLSHHGQVSSAFLIESDGDYLLYFGDTGSDSSEESNCLNHLWEKIVPLIKEKKLKGMLIECSYASHPHREKLYGHFNTQSLMEEFRKLAHKVSPKMPTLALEGLKIVITHIKVEQQEGPNVRTHIQLELNEMNDLHLQFIFPVQGMRIDF